jgi:hypothetical protein
MTLLVLGLAILGSVAAAQGADAQDLSAGLANAEQQASQAEGEISARQTQLNVAEASYESAARRVAPIQEDLRAARGEIAGLNGDLSTREQRAAGHISELEANHQQEVDDHDEEVRNGVGFGLAALAAAGIAFAWGWFRASAPVAALSNIDLRRAIGLCVGGALIILILGAALGSSDGAAGAFGSFLFCLGLIVPTALLLARHSASVQRGVAKPLLGRDRLPRWVPLTASAIAVLLFLASTGSAIFAEGASSEPITAQLTEEAEARSSGRGAAELEAAKEEAARLKKDAAAPLARKRTAGSELARARRRLVAAERSMTKAEASQEYFTDRLAAVTAREEREAAKAAEVAQREEDELLEQEEEEFAAECNPNYSGCLDPNSPDYDCAGGSGDGPDYTGTVEVTGYDEYGLDEDGDGIGCDP